MNTYPPEPEEPTPDPDLAGYTSSSGGGGKGFALFLAIVAASVAIFFLFTQRKCTSKVGGERIDDVGISEVEEKASISSDVEAKTQVSPELASEATPVKYSEAAGLIGGFDAAIRAGEVNDLSVFFAPDDVGEKQALAASQIFDRLTRELGYRVPTEEGAIQQLGKTGDSLRYAMGIVSPTGERHEILLDTVPDAETDWRIGRIQFPESLRVVVTGDADDPLSVDGDPSVKAAEQAAAAVIMAAEEDALQVSADFVRHVLAHDYDAAREKCDFDKVNSEKIAALCFVFEEGGFQLLEEKPIVVTASNPETSWAIARVRSSQWGSQAEFGIELERVAAERPDPAVEAPPETWEVVGLNFSELLGAYADASDAGEIAYTPMVSSPGGGESLALYFEYDKGGLHPRAERQLKIVSKVLKGDATKQLKITGHADALGTEDYNLELSASRAANVSEYLISLGVPAEQIVTIAAGEAAPLRPNTTEAGDDNPDGRAHNRRAEIFLDF